MAELKGVDLTAHLDCIFEEYKTTESIYGFPKNKMYFGDSGFDFSVNLYGKRAETPLGPAAGPHTQMAQNIILAFLGGSRIIELKTIQILDELEIGRPCIDMRNIGFNIEWSQEMKLEDSYCEYVTAWILLKILQESEILGVHKDSPFYDTIFDISVGYDLQGIKNKRVSEWINNMRDASVMIAAILENLPQKYARFKNLKINPHISDSITLSTFHGCPVDEIESIVQHLVSEHNMHVIVKMNPTLLGYDFVSKTLHQSLGYRHIELDKAAFDNDLQFDQAVPMMNRLFEFGKEHNRTVGVKFTNTLVVKNNEKIFSEEIQYLSGAPLHVLAMTAMHRFREALNNDIPYSFSAGINKTNFVEAVLCNLKPVTVCSDLLQKGGYTRQFFYLQNLKKEMEKTGCTNINDFICAHGENENVFQAGRNFSTGLVNNLANDKRYRHISNKSLPKKIGSHLELFDCITCNICLPVCPNAANFSIPTGKINIPVTNYKYSNGQFKPVEGSELILQKENQIANIADFCNDCGNCDTFCPEDGGPFVEKPRFFLSNESYQRYKNLDGFHFAEKNVLFGRINGAEYKIQKSDVEQGSIFMISKGKIYFDKNDKILSANFSIKENDIIDLHPYFVLKILSNSIIQSPEFYAKILLLKKNNPPNS